MVTIFFIESPSQSVAHGVGSYAANLIPELLQTGAVSVYYVRITLSDEGNVSHNHISENYTKINISFQHKTNEQQKEMEIPPLMVRGVFCILSAYFSDTASTIFHLNSILQGSFAEIAKEYDFKLVYTQHISLWRVFYSNDKKRFLEQWGNPDPQSRRNSFIKSIDTERKLCETADRIISLTADNKNFTMAHLGIPGEKIAIVPNGLAATIQPECEVQNGNHKPAFGFREDDFIFLFVGRLIRQKGLHILLQAFRQIAPAYRNMKLLIAGKGDITEYAAQIADICGQVSFTGYIPNDQLYRYYQIADAGIMPSSTEQSSFVVLEMLHRQLPLIVSDIEAFGYPLANEENLLKVKTDDYGTVSSDALAAAMIRLYKNEQLRNKLKVSAGHVFDRYYKGSIMAGNTLVVYQTLHNELK